MALEHLQDSVSRGEAVRKHGADASHLQLQLLDDRLPGVCVKPQASPSCRLGSEVLHMPVVRLHYTVCTHGNRTSMRHHATESTTVLAAFATARLRFG